MFTNLTTMPREHMHSKRCLASALISAVENLRDAERMTDHQFRMNAQEGSFLAMADDYLADGLSDCLCHSWDLATSDDGLAHGICACGWRSADTDDSFQAARWARCHAQDARAAAWHAVGVQL